MTKDPAELYRKLVRLREKLKRLQRRVSALERRLKGKKYNFGNCSFHRNRR